MRKRVALLGLMWALALSSAVAADGATPVWEPTTISTPGKYVLTRNISDTLNPVISITADNVTLDLNGFQISGDANAFAADVVLVSGNGVTVTNGTILGGGAAVRVSASATQFALSNLVLGGGRTGVGTAAGSALGLVEGNRIEDVTDGISGTGSALQIRRNVVSADGKGIFLDGCNSCLVSENTIRDASDVAISVVLGGGNLILNNTASGSGTGIRVGQGGYHHLEGNVMSGNTAYGVHLRDTSFDNVYRRNTARNNGGSGCTGVSTTDFCDEGTGNTSQGDNYLPDQR